jgi:translation initiation factor 3 subunit B
MSSQLDYLRSLDDYEEIKDYLDLEALEDVVDDKKYPPFEPDFSTSIIVDNIPAVPQDKVAKLTAVLLKVYSQNAKITEADIYMPFNEETGTTYGFCFIKFNTVDEAQHAVKVTQGFAIDKKHSFKVSMYTDLDKYAKIPDEYEQPKAPQHNPRPDPTSWLTDPQGRDQFVARYSHETEIMWANHTGEDPTLVYGGDREKQGGKVWCESYVAWSPQGNFLATFHAPGVKLWGSADFQSLGRFMHPKVEELSFSPCENYLITYRYSFHADLNPAEAIIVWDVRTNAKLRTFELKNPLDVKFQVQATVNVEGPGGKRVDRVIRGRVKSYEGDSSGGHFVIEEGNTVHENVPSDKVTPIQEPNRLKWSPDGNYVARLGNDIISVYTLPSMTLLEQKSIAAKDVLDFVWSPKSNQISYWSPAVGNHPALISIIRIPSRQDVCSRKLFDVTDGRMVWQNEGDYLCVYMTKNQGKKRSYVLMFFRLKDQKDEKRDVPVEQLELTEPIISVTWEPSGDRVAIMHGEARSPSVAFYSMINTSVKEETAVSTKVPAKGAGTSANRNELTHLFTRSGTQCSEVIWSPAGGVVALPYFAPDTCIFDLYDVENNIVLASQLRHDRCSRMYWDPSGRFLATCTITDLRNASARANFEDGFNIYTFQGKLLNRVKREKLYQFSWRPRPKDLLSAEERKAVIKNLRKYEKMFEKEDRQRKQELNQEILAARHKRAEEFLTWLNRSRAASAALKPRRVAIRNGYDSDDERNYKIEAIVSTCILRRCVQLGCYFLTLVSCDVPC